MRGSAFWLAVVSVWLVAGRSVCGLELCNLRTGVFADMNSAFWLAGNLLRTGVFADLNSAFWLAGVSVCSLQSLTTTESQLNREDGA